MINIMGLSFNVNSNTKEIFNFLHLLNDQLTNLEKIHKLYLEVNYNKNTKIKYDDEKLEIDIYYDKFSEEEKNFLIQQIFRYCSYINFRYYGKFALLHGSSVVRFGNEGHLIGDYNNCKGKTSTFLHEIINYGAGIIEDEFTIIDLETFNLYGINYETTIHIREEVKNYFELNTNNSFESPEVFNQKKQNNISLTYITIPLSSISDNISKEEIFNHILYSHIIKFVYPQFDRFTLLDVESNGEEYNFDKIFIELTANNKFKYESDKLNDVHFSFKDIRRMNDVIHLEVEGIDNVGKTHLVNRLYSSFLKNEKFKKADNLYCFFDDNDIPDKQWFYTHSENEQVKMLELAFLRREYAYLKHNSIFDRGFMTLQASISARNGKDVSALNMSNAINISLVFVETSLELIQRIRRVQYADDYKSYQLRLKEQFERVLFNNIKKTDNYFFTTVKGIDMLLKQCLVAENSAIIYVLDIEY